MKSREKSVVVAKFLQFWGKWCQLGTWVLYRERPPLWSLQLKIVITKIRTVMAPETTIMTLETASQAAQSSSNSNNSS